MRFVPWVVMVAAALVAGCSDKPGVDRVGQAAALAQVIAQEQDHVSVAELADWIIKDQRDFELVDIREASEFEAGHIDTARNIPLAALLSEDALASLPTARKVVIYSNGTAHAAQAALLLRLADREGYALLGGFNYWKAYHHDPASAGVAEMDPVRRAQYQAVSCFFEGDYVAQAGLVPKDPRPPEAPQAGSAAAKPDPLGLGLGLGSEEVREARDKGGDEAPADPLGLGLEHGLGGEAGKAVQGASKPDSGTTRRLLIKAEC